MFNVEQHEWWSVYCPVHEELPLGMPEPKRKPVRTTTFVDANLMHDQVTSQSATGILHLLNKTSINWYSKRQNTVETANMDLSLLRLALLPNR